MVDDPHTKIEQVTAEYVYQYWIHEDDLCTRLGIGPELLSLCQEWDIIHPSQTTPEGKMMFSQQMVDRLVSGLRLHRDLGINWEGVSVVLQLLERIEELESQLQERFIKE